MQLDVAMLSYAGMACWAMSTKRLRRDLAFPRLPGAMPMRAIAALLVAMGAWRSIDHFGPYQGSVVWIGLLSATALLLVLLLSHWPRLAIAAAAAAATIAIYAMAAL